MQKPYNREHVTADVEQWHSQKSWQRKHGVRQITPSGHSCGRLCCYLHYFEEASWRGPGGVSKKRSVQNLNMSPFTVWRKLKSIWRKLRVSKIKVHGIGARHYIYIYIIYIYVYIYKYMYIYMYICMYIYI